MGGELKTGRQKERMDNFNILCSGGVLKKISLRMDGQIIRNLISMANYRGEDTNWDEVPQLMEIADFQKMEQIRARLWSCGRSENQESLKPYYRQFARGPVSTIAIYKPSTAKRSNWSTQMEKESRELPKRRLLAEKNMRSLIFATGFEVGTSYVRRSGYDVTGLDGLNLSDKWAEGMRTLHGVMTSGFPNLFIISNSQAGFTTNFPHAMDETSQHIGYILNECRKDNLASIDVEKEAEDKWVEEIIVVSRFASDFQESCTPGYYNNEGKPNPKSVQNGPYGKARGPISESPQPGARKEIWPASKK